MRRSQNASEHYFSRYVYPAHPDKMGRKNKVMTPRNVDLPMSTLDRHRSVVIRATDSPSSLSSASPSALKASAARRKKFLCLSAWLAFLLLLCAGIVVIAHFLLPKSITGEWETCRRTGSN